MADRKAAARVDLALLDPDGAFPARLAADRAALVAWLAGMQAGAPETGEERMNEIATLSHKLAGAAGTFGYCEISDAALALEELILDRPPGPGAPVRLDSLRRAADTLVRMLGEGLSAKR